MRRNSLKLTALAAMAFAGGAVGLNCSKSSNPNSGDVKLAVVLPSGSTLTTINYKILSSTSTQIAGGSFNVSDPHATVSLDIVVPVTPTGDAGDTVNLTATSSTGESCTGTSAPFPVLAGTNPAVTMTLTCGTGTQPGQTGNIGVTATLVEGDNCPSITSAVVGPAETSVGGSAMVIATASDPDASETLTYAWAPAANFTTPGSSGSSYKCLAAGVQSFTLTVSDSHAPTPCQTVATLTIKCDNVATCGNGMVEPGETCDPPNGTTCSASCQTIGGTGGTTGTGGIAATGGTTGTGGAAGMGMAGAPGTGGVAGTTGTGGIAATGGTTGTGGTPVFTQDNAACVSCELTGTSNGVCFTTSPPGGGTSAANFGCDGFANATDKQHCLDLVGCLRSTACQNVIAAAGADYGEAGVNFDDGSPCLCNNATTTTTKNACFGQTSWTTGICAAQFVAASNNATSNSTPVSSLFDPAFPVGVAMNLMTCDVDSKQPGSGTANCTTATTCKVPQ
jgi:hypothetical protein